MKKIANNFLKKSLTLLLAACLVVVLFLLLKDSAARYKENMIRDEVFQKDEYCRTTYKNGFDEKIEKKLFKTDSLEEYYSIHDIFYSPKMNECFVKYEISSTVEYKGELTFSTSIYLQQVISDNPWTFYKTNTEGSATSLEFYRTEQELRSWDGIKANSFLGL